MLRLVLSQLLGRRDWRDDLSAYLDDELSPGERARVEGRLAESEEMQDYLDDLCQMRSLLRGFAGESARAPFQLSAEMFHTRAPAQLRPSPIERGLRVSMTTAAVGFATFSAVLIFDVIDQPPVSVTQTAADGVVTIAVPTVAVVTEPVPQEVATSIGSAPASVTVVSIESTEQAVEVDSTQQRADRALKSSQTTDERPQAQEQVEQQQAYQQQAFEQAARDPSRLGINAGGQDISTDAKHVSAEDVVAQQARGVAEAGSSATTSISPSAGDESSDESEIVLSGSEYLQESPNVAEVGSDDAAHRVELESQVEMRTVVTSAGQMESKWPLDQRPRTSSVRVAVDPSWEMPVQIALATIAVASTLAWLLLTAVHRRRRI